MQEILQLLDETNMINNELLTNEQIVEIYKATTEEEREWYMLLIQNFLDDGTTTTISDLQQAVSYLNVEAFIYKSWMIPVAKSEETV